MINLWGLDRRQYAFPVHRLVLTAFVYPPNGRLVCRHLDGNPTNNYVGNLRWGTYQENSDDMKVHGTYMQGSRVATAKLTEDDVRVIKRSRHTATVYELADRFGVKPATIYKIWDGTNWGHVVA